MTDARPHDTPASGHAERSPADVLAELDENAGEIARWEAARDRIAYALLLVRPQ